MPMNRNDTSTRSWRLVACCLPPGRFWEELELMGLFLPKAPGQDVASYRESKTQ